MDEIRERYEIGSPIHLPNRWVDTYKVYFDRVTPGQRMQKALESCARMSAKQPMWPIEIRHVKPSGKYVIVALIEPSGFEWFYDET
jgi:hypothetical protein